MGDFLRDFCSEVRVIALFRAIAFKLKYAPESLGGLVKTHIPPDPTPRDFGSVCLRQSVRICISKIFLCEAVLCHP